jgi:twitching motility two-component system response regulator PilH
MKVLVADDDPDFVVLLTTFLEERGWRTIVARDALQASMVARRDIPDAVILDINMPGGSGIRALKQLKASPRVGRIPIVVVSARDDEQLPRTVAELGAAAFLRKPVTLSDLHQLLVQLLGEPVSQPAGRP